MRAIITVIGKDMVGILAKVSTICAEYDAVSYTHLPHFII